MRHFIYFQFQFETKEAFQICEISALFVYLLQGWPLLIVLLSVRVLVVDMDTQRVIAAVDVFTVHDRFIICIALNSK